MPSSPASHNRPASPADLPAAADLPARIDVVVAGAGLAGLACAVRLTQAGAGVIVLERDATVGGRVRSERVDGFRCDRGFQLINPAYPEARRVLDLAALRLRPFPAAVVVADDSGRRVLGDPTRVPARLVWPALRGDLGAAGGPRAKVAFARWALSCAARDPADILSVPDEPWGVAADRLGVTGRLRREVLEPFLAGTLAEIDGSTSRRFVELLIRSFVRGRPSVPWEGMQAVPDQLATALPAGTVRCGVEVTSLAAGPDGGRLVRTAGGEVAARAVVVATDPVTAGQLTGIAVPEVRPLTTYWHAVDGAPTDSAALHVDGARRGPLVNTVVISNAAPGYAPAGRALVASTVLGVPGPDGPGAEPAVRRLLGQVYGTDTGGWELVTAHALRHALTAMAPPLDLRRAVDLGGGLLVAGDHRDSASQQGALVSGRRAADAVLAHLGLPVPPRPPLDALRGTRGPRPGGVNTDGVTR